MMKAAKAAMSPRRCARATSHSAPSRRTATVRVTAVLTAPVALPARLVRTSTAPRAP